jgi:hypothetical protein
MGERLMREKGKQCLRVELVVNRVVVVVVVVVAVVAVVAAVAAVVVAAVTVATSKAVR